MAELIKHGIYSHIESADNNIYSIIYPIEKLEISNLNKDHYDRIKDVGIDSEVDQNDQRTKHSPDEDHYDKIDLSPKNFCLSCSTIESENRSLEESENIYDTIDPFEDERLYVYCGCKTDVTCAMHSSRDDSSKYEKNYFHKWISWRTRANSQLAYFILRKGRSDIDLDGVDNNRKALEIDTVGAVFEHAFSGKSPHSSLRGKGYVMYGIPRVHLATT